MNWLNRLFYSEQILCRMLSNWVWNNSEIYCFLAVQKCPVIFFRPKKGGSIKTHEKILNSTPKLFLKNMVIKGMFLLLFMQKNLKKVNTIPSSSFLKKFFLFCTKMPRSPLPTCAIKDTLLKFYKMSIVRVGHLESDLLFLKNH